jgi:hypothetical protein
MVKGKVACITHVPTASEFMVDEREDGSESYLVATRTVADVYINRANRYDDFDILASAAKEWADELAEWMNIPDIWENHPAPGGIPGELAPDSSNTRFTLEEQATVSAQLKAIAESVKRTYEPTAKQSAEVDRKFEEAEKASSRMGRKDWGLLFGGAVFSLILSDAITPGIAWHVLMMVEHGIGHMFMGGPPAVHGILSAGQD